jgi:hypothetical protein
LNFNSRLLKTIFQGLLPQRIALSQLRAISSINLPLHSAQAIRAARSIGAFADPSFSGNARDFERRGVVRNS